MTHFRIRFIGLVVVLMLPLLCGLGCNRNTAPPTPLSVEQLPSAFEKAFTKAKPEAKELANQIVAAVQAKDYSKAFNGLQSLLGMADLSKEQANVMSRGLLTINDLLQAAQAKGDAKATETIDTYLKTK